MGSPVLVENRCPELGFMSVGNVLPLGCHGWCRFDRASWEPYLLSEPEAESPPSAA